MLVFMLTILPVLCFTAYTGWRHVGVIDPAVWRVYSVMFPVLSVACLFIVLSLLVEYGSLYNIINSELAQAVGFLNIGYIGLVALLGWISLLLLRRMNIAAMGTTVDKILLRLYQKAGVSSKKAIEIKRINKPRGLVIGTAGLLLLAAVILAPVPDEAKVAKIFLRLSEQVSLLGFFLLVRARRYFQIDADALLAVDRRPPILFLRSFDDDEKQRFTRADKALLDFSLETRLSNHFSRFGPFIAIGSPKETVPQLGAARVLLSDEEWQPRVLGWMQEAGLIIMYSGKTHWVNWELRQIIENQRTTRLILMFPEIRAWRRSKRKAEISARVEQVRQVFKNTPWEEELAEFRDFPGLRAMLFRPDGSMVMVKSQSRSRDSYHLAALIAHEYLLDPDRAVTAADADLAAPRFFRSLAAFVALAAVIGAVVGAVYLISEGGDSRLAFKQGELYFSEPVTEDEARPIGEYLVQRGIFSDNHGSTVQLHLEQGIYQLRFVINPEHVDDFFTALEFGIIGRHIATKLLGGKPVEVIFADNQLKPKKVVPLSALMMFGKGELYYSEPVTSDEAHRVGTILVQEEFFSDDWSSTACFYFGQGRYRLRLVISPEYVEDPFTAIQFGFVGKQIDRRVLAGRPVDVEFADEQLNLIKIVPPSAIMMFGKGELYYSEPVTAAEANKVGAWLWQSGYFSDDRGTSVHLSRKAGVFQLKFVINPSRQADPEVRAAFMDIGRGIAAEALDGHPTDMHLCDGNFTTLYSKRL
jgi:hypothetical protein